MSARERRLKEKLDAANIALTTARRSLSEGGFRILADEVLLLQDRVSKLLEPIAYLGESQENKNNDQ